jgi:hypothetical protein
LIKAIAAPVALSVNHYAAYRKDHLNERALRQRLAHDSLFSALKSNHRDTTASRKLCLYKDLLLAFPAETQ